MTCLIIFGPPGSGKGTQAKRIVKFFGGLTGPHGITHVSTGAILRQTAQYDTALGRTVAKLLPTGELVPDSLVNEIVVECLEHLTQDVILDGYPRTVEQALLLVQEAKARNINLVVLHLKIEHDEVLIDRIIERNEGRVDDTEPVIRERLMIYQAQTFPVLAALQTQDVVILEVNGESSEDDVQRIIIGKLISYLNM